MRSRYHRNPIFTLGYRVRADFVSYLTLGVDKKDEEFITSLLEKTCTYEKQWMPKQIHNVAMIMKDDFSQYKLGMDVADEEAMAIAGRSVEELFERTGVDPARVDVLVCVSTQATLMQRAIAGNFGFREDLEVMTLGGMGCAGGVMATDFVHKYLAQRKTPATVVAVCHETVTRGFYTGLSRESMVTNALFRANGCAMMFSTDPSLKANAKFKMDHSTRTYQVRTMVDRAGFSHYSESIPRTHHALITHRSSTAPQTDDPSFWCMGVKLDESGVAGIYLPKKEMLGDISSRAIGHTMARVGREILPIGEKLKYVLSGGRTVPDFLKAVDHVFVHPGGPAVIEKLGKALGYDAAVETVSSINAYYFYGNTSSSGVLYSMAHTESLHGIKKGERVLALGLGAGFESNGTVMTAVRDCGDVHRAWKHVAEDPSLQSLAVDAFVRGFRNRERICRLEASDERKVRDLKEFMAKRGYKNPFGPEPTDKGLVSHLSGVAMALLNLSPNKGTESVSSFDSESTQTVSVDKAPVAQPLDGQANLRQANLRSARKLSFDQPQAIM